VPADAAWDATMVGCGQGHGGVGDSQRHHPTMFPPDRDFLQQVDELLMGLVRKLDGLDPDELEADLAAGVLRITFADRRTCILNRQAAANQIWMAEGATAWHFAFDPVSRSWMDTKGRGELTRILGEVVGRRLGRSVPL
jgi:CyaY protein